MKTYLWQALLIIGIILNIITYKVAHNSDCFTAACSLAIVYVIFAIDEKNKK